MIPMIAKFRNFIGILILNLNKYNLIINMECEFCKTTFSSISSLNKHKVKTKYCLKLQGIDTNSIVCEYCNECFSSMKTIDKHMKKCAIIKLTKDNETLKKQIQEQLLKLKENQDEIQSLKDQLYKKDIEIAELKSANNIYKDSQECLKEIAKQPKTTTTTTNNNKNYMNMPVFNLTKESIENMVKKNFTFDHLQDGQTGVACFTVDNLLKDKDNNLLYECSDPSRNMFVYKTQKGIEKDLKRINLLN